MPTKTILTVEDDPAIRRGIVDALKYIGYSVLEAGHGDLGHEMAVRQSYDLLLLDLVLPGRGGLEILRSVRATRPTQPVIILTARGEENDRVEGLRAGSTRSRSSKSYDCRTAISCPRSPCPASSTL